MLVRKLFFFLVAIIVSHSAYSQDIHFTQFNMMPYQLNPGLIGTFEGTARIGGIYRSQWRSALSSGQYSTPGLFVDAPIIRGFRKRDWVGVGAGFVSDRAGSPAFKRSIFNFGASYNLALNRQATTYLTVGAQYGNESRSTGTDFTFGEELRDPKTPAQDPYANGQDPKANFTDINAGISLTSRLNSRMDFNIGFAMIHVAEPGASLNNQDPTAGRKMPRRTVLHGRFNLGLTDKLTLSPSFLFQTISAQDEIQIQALAAYLFNPERDIAIHTGLGYRLGRDVAPIIGGRYKTLTVGASYDFNISDADRFTSNRGGFEIAANYIVRIYKPAKAIPKVLCPRF